MFSTSPLDWGLILLYFGFLAAVWAGAFGHRPGALEYLVAGRRVTLPALVATLVATLVRRHPGRGRVLVAPRARQLARLRRALLHRRAALRRLLREARTGCQALHAARPARPRLRPRTRARGGARGVHRGAARRLRAHARHALRRHVRPAAGALHRGRGTAVGLLHRQGRVAGRGLHRPGAVRPHVLGLRAPPRFLVAQHGTLSFLRAHAATRPFHLARRQSAPGHLRLVLHRALGARGPGLLAARLRGPRPEGRAQRRAVVGRVLGGVRLHDHDGRPLRTGPAAPAQGPGVRLPRVGAHHAAAVRARPLLPLHDRHGDEHDRFLRVHRRGHGGPRRRLAHRARRRGPRAAAGHATACGSPPASPPRSRSPTRA